MLVKDFVSEFKAKNIMNTKIVSNAVEDYIRKTLEIKEYVPFTEKRELCTQVIETSCHKKNGIVIVDSVDRYILFTISMLNKYTNLEFDADEEMDSIDEYDLLCESGLLDNTLDAIGDEYIKCNNLLNMMLQDVIDNNNTVEATISYFSSNLISRIDDITTVLIDKIDGMNLDLNQLDIEKYKPLLDKLGGLTE